MTGPYQRAIEHLARTYEQDSPVYSGAFELAVATFPAYTAPEIAADVMKQRRMNYERSHPMNPPVFVRSAGEIDALMGPPNNPYAELAGSWDESMAHDGGHYRGQ